MRVEVTMPRMGQSMEEGIVLTWLKKVGAYVERGEPLIAIETDKAAVEIEAFASGILVEILIGEGAVATVGSVLAIIEAEMPGVTPSPAPAEDIEIIEPEPSANAGRSARLPISPVARRMAQEHQFDVSAVTGTGMQGRVTRVDVAAAMGMDVLQMTSTPAAAHTIDPINGGGRIMASPLARRMAQAARIDLATLHGSAPEGWIIKRDIEAALKARDAEIAPAPIAAPLPVAPREASNGATALNSESAPSQRVPLTKIRRVTGQRMVESKTTIPHFYLTIDVPMERAMSLRESLKARGHECSVNDIILRGVTLALAAYPGLNATFADGDLLLHTGIHLAVAVALGEKDHPDGLITPVVHHCEALTLPELAAGVSAVVGRARAGKLRPDDLDGGTFTVSNLGMFGIRQFEAIVNPPQVAILAVGAIRTEAIFDARGGVMPTRMLSATLSADHRATDGAEAAGFLKTFKDIVEDGFALLQ